MSQHKMVRLRRERRKRRVRHKVRGTAERPRLSVFRSSKHIYAQLIDDDAGVTLAAAGTSGKDAGYGGNVKAAQTVGQKIAAAAKAKGISQAAFDRGSYRFHGRVQALAVAATEAGLKCCDPKNIKRPEPKAPAGEAKAEAKAKPEAKPKGEGKPKGEAKKKEKGGEKAE